MQTVEGNRMFLSASDLMRFLCNHATIRDLTYMEHNARVQRRSTVS